MKYVIPLALLLVALAANGHAQQRRQSAPISAENCAAKQGALPEKWEGRAFAIDGDTLAGVGLKPHIRLWGIQAPELRDHDKQETMSGMRARAMMEDLLTLADHKIDCRVLKWDRYCRIVATCELTMQLEPLVARGIPPPAAPAKPTPYTVDLGAESLKFGMSYGFWLDDVLPWDDGASLRYANIEAQARKERRGLWKGWIGEK